MKNLFLLICILLLPEKYSALAQVLKTSIAEHFTNTSCSVCAANNPSIYKNLSDNPSVLHISYHPSSPYPNDFFNVQNKSENDNRTIYYGVYGSTPRIVLNGKPVNYSSLSTVLPALSDDSSNFYIRVDQVQFGADSFSVTVSIKKVANDTNSKAKLFLAAVESVVTKNTNNRESMHYNVFRKELMFAGFNGMVNLPFGIGDSTVLQFKFKANSDWDLNRLFSIGILQNSNTKTVLQTGKSSLSNTGTSILREQKDQAIALVYPNPSHENIHLASDLDLLNIYNFSGQLILSIENPKSNCELDVSEFDKGIYLLQGYKNGNIYSEKLILE